MKIAYIISAYQYPFQLIRLVRALNSPNAIFLVHVDKKTNSADYARMLNGLRDLSNVTFMRRQKCYWGEFGHVRATLTGMAELIDKRVDFDYVVLLTGQDYPIKPVAYIEQCLRDSGGQQFIEYDLISDDAQQRRSTTYPKTGKRATFYAEHWHIRLFDKHFWLPRHNRQLKWSRKSLIGSIARLFFENPELPRHYQIFVGSSYWCLTRNCVIYVNSFVRENPNFVSFFNHVFIPDEIFFQTIILNSPFKDSVVNDNLRCIDWSEGGNSPRVWRKHDVEILKRSKALIARKFDHTVDAEILDLIDNQLLLRTPSG
jgi:hypothetical protein